MFDKTGTLTVGGARLIAVETAPARMRRRGAGLRAHSSKPRSTSSLRAIVEAALAKGLALQIPDKCARPWAPGLEGVIDGREVCVGSHQLVHGAPQARGMGAARAAARLVAFGAQRVRIGRRAAYRRPAARRRTAARDAARRAACCARRVCATIVMVTGDRADAAETIGAALDLDAVLADRVPSDKVDAVATEQRLRPDR